MNKAQEVLELLKNEQINGISTGQVSNQPVKNNAQHAIPKTLKKYKYSPKDPQSVLDKSKKMIDIKSGGR